MSLPRAARNTIIQMIGRAFSTLFGVVALALVTRYLGQERYGWYTTVTTYLQFFGILADFGLTLITAQMLSEPGVDEKKTLSNLFTFRLILSGLFFGASVLLIWLFPYPLIIKLGVLVMVATFYAVTLQNIFMGFFQKHIEMKVVAFGDAWGRLVILIGYGLCIWQNWGLLPILFISVLANVSQMGILWRYTRKMVGFTLAYDKAVFKDIFHRSWPVAISISFNLIYLKADTLILSLVRTQSEVGLYGAAYRMIDVLSNLPMMFMGIMLPLLTFAWSTGDKEQFKHYFRRAFDIVSIMILPMTAGGIFLARPLMTFLAGREFTDSGIYLQILFVALLAIFFGAVPAHAIIALKKQRDIIWWYIIDAVISLIAYIILIPRFGGVAAAWVTVFSEAFIAVATATMVWRTAHVLLSFKIFSKSLLATAIMILVINFFSYLHVFYLCLIAILTYFTAIYLVKGITKQMITDLVRSK